MTCLSSTGGNIYCHTKSTKSCAIYMYSDFKNVGTSIDECQYRSMVRVNWAIAFGILIGYHLEQDVVIRKVEILGQVAEQFQIAEHTPVIIQVGLNQWRQGYILVVARPEAFSMVLHGANQKANVARSIGVRHVTYG